MAATQVRRKYALRKVAAGDYLLVGNDGRTLWRIASYEDGIEQGLDHDLGTVWGAWRYYTPIRQGAILDLDWDFWAMEASTCGTRAEAIGEALRMSPEGTLDGGS